MSRIPARCITLEKPVTDSMSHVIQYSFGHVFVEIFSPQIIKNFPLLFHALKHLQMHNCMSERVKFRGSL